MKQRVSFLNSMFVFFMITVAACAGKAQNRYGIFYEEVCWTTAGGVDSSIIRVNLALSQTTAPTQLYYLDAAMNVISVSGGSVANCWCSNFPPANVALPEFSTFGCSQPTINPFNPSACGSTVSSYVLNINSIDQIQVEINDSIVVPTYDPVSNFIVYNSGNVGRTGPYVYKITLTNEFGTVVDSCSFDCR